MQYRNIIRRCSCTGIFALIIVDLIRGIILVTVTVVIASAGIISTIVTAVTVVISIVTVTTVVGISIIRVFAVISVSGVISLIRGICISPRRGTAKYPVETAKIVPDWGIEEDAHGGKWHRQISLLALEKIEAFREKGADVDFGAFGENLIVEGFDLRNVPVDSEIRIGDAVRLKVTQIGKECHTHCAIYQRMGDCIMPREGIFAEVLTGGMIRVGDCVEVVMPQEDRPYSVAVITLSDKAFAGERDDLSGPAIEKILKDSEEKDHIRFDIKETILLPDGEEGLKKQLIRLADQRQVDLILTTGGTGFAPRDMTPEATNAVCDRMANGIADAIRNYSMTITDRAMFSRAVSGLRKKTLIINLPGSPKAVTEALGYILPKLPHGLDVLRGNVQECGRK